MPIKLPKGFTRRKSSGNALEEVENPPQPSFRVFERPAADRKSLSDANLLSKRLSDGQDLYTPTEEEDNIFAGTENLPPKHRSLSLTRRQHSGGIPGGSSESSSSIRFSSSSLRRSSTDVPIQANGQSPHTRHLHDIPIPPISGALRAAGRTFSFGGRFSKPSPSIAPDRPPIRPPPRNRTMTSSTASTATPPKLLDDLNVGGLGDEFGNMFDDLGKRESVLLPEPISGRKSPNMFSSSSHSSPATTRKEEKAARPAPINTNVPTEVEASPYSWDSRHSGEGLLNAMNSPPVDFPGNRLELPSPNSSFPEGRRKSLPLASAVPNATTSHRSLMKPQTTGDKGLRRSVIYSTKRDSAPVEDEDARLIMESLHTTKNGVHFASSSDHEASDSENHAPLAVNGSANAAHRPGLPESHSQTRRQSLPVAESQLDPSIAAHAMLAAQYEQSQPKSSGPANKVMTPSQFEHYRRQQELRRSNSDASKSEDSAESDFDEEDEVEKSREAERLRRKQEAHLSVYRQQMMKMTGQQSPAPSLRPELDRASNSTPNLPTLPMNSGTGPGAGNRAEGDEDEDIPLGILAAHGFPNRNRPPTRLAPSSSIPNLRASFHQPYVSSPGSVAGDNDLTNRSSLPVFARNLPRDPYYGASLVNQANRESLAFGGGGGGASVHGGPTAASALPPGGLVGVIATEERARAMRRGSPNTQAVYEFQTGMGMAGSTTPPGGVPRPYTMMGMNPPALQPSVSATEQAQIQLSQQMSQMMQVQMQWMQQMIHMQGGQTPPGPPMLPPMGFPPSLPAGANFRPASMPSAGPFNQAPAGLGDQRTLSMLDPNGPSRLNGPAMPYLPQGIRPGTPGGAGYAPSIAPSERSNVGMAPRYRPVSTIHLDQGSTVYSPMANKWNDENQKAAPPAVSHMAKTPSMPIVTVQPIPTEERLSTQGRNSTTTGKDDEDDDEGWAEMMKKREKKRSNWKVKKETSSLGDLLNAVH
ncbi:uncharacterized protein ACLA_005540 [Aspergillus clavatus NRRL 1]|uniref:Uncharacterized protein n=1 Tax=Aspergillus clavatus (strain ATCC 1007 / CBS 513.65 / DSM 816 / NCTC 3887 / NRRL 1 / QM 1276 / 107) TaxID=344612 RepID=A1CD71_ASPCL|nr:uncharacterized protein ACLA_005540 [Aspergillus clavatus NRRL 1]EAW11798.1 conserved hypothetical protein [Aspergillus clavatus NRRL 1]